MRAAVVTEPGGPEVFKVVERPDPLPGPDEVLVDVKASALNRADLAQRRQAPKGGADARAARVRGVRRAQREQPTSGPLANCSGPRPAGPPPPGHP